MISRTTNTAVVELSKRSDLSRFLLADGVDLRQTWVMLLAVGIVALATAGGGATGWLVMVEGLTRPDLSLAGTLIGMALTGGISGAYILGMLLNAAVTSYEAEMRERGGAVGSGRSLVTPGDNPRRRVVLTEDDKRLLRTFARHYPARETLAIGRWEGRANPFGRDEIKRVRSLLHSMGLAERDGGNNYELNDAGKGRLSQWAAGQFEDTTPLPSEGDHARS